MKPLSDCRLYGILDLGYVAPDAAVETARQMVAGGVDILQIRAKKLLAPDMASKTSRASTPRFPTGRSFALAASS